MAPGEIGPVCGSVAFSAGPDGFCCLVALSVQTLLVLVSSCWVLMDLDGAFSAVVGYVFIESSFLFLSVVVFLGDGDSGLWTTTSCSLGMFFIS